MKKNILAIICCFSSMSVYAGLQEAPSELEKAKIEVTTFDENNIDSFHLLKKETVGERSMDKILKNYHKEFQKRLKSINKEMFSYENDIFKQIDSNISKGEKNIARTEKLREKNCSGEITDESVHEECQSLEQSIFDDKEKIKSMKMEKKSFSGQIAVDKKNRVMALYTNYKNLVGNSKAEYESKK